MNLKHTIALAVGLGLLLPAIGCGTIASGRHSDVTIISNPASAHVVIKDRKGKEVTSTETPAVVNLQRGYYLMPAHYVATVEAPGYEPKQVNIDYKLNPWMWGNLIFGILGAPVGIIVDDSTGAMWKPKQDTIALNLAPNPAANPVATSRPGQLQSYSTATMAGNLTQQVEYQEPLSRR